MAGGKEAPAASNEVSKQVTVKEQLNSFQKLLENPVKGLEEMINTMLDAWEKDPVLGHVVKFFRGVQEADNPKEDPDARAQLVKEKFGKEVGKLTTQDIDTLVQQGWMVPFLNPRYTARDITSPGSYTFWIDTLRHENLLVYEHVKEQVPLTKIFPAEVKYLQVRGQVYARTEDGYQRNGHKLTIDMLNAFEVVEGAQEDMDPKEFKEMLQQPNALQSLDFGKNYQLAVGAFGAGPAVELLAAMDRKFGGKGCALTRMVALGIHEGKLHFGRENRDPASGYNFGTFQIGGWGSTREVSAAKFNRSLERGKQLYKEYFGTSIGTLNKGNRDLLAHLGYIYNERGGDKIMQSLANPAIGDKDLVKLMHYWIQGGIKDIGESVLYWTRGRGASRKPPAAYVDWTKWEQIQSQSA